MADMAPYSESGAGTLQRFQYSGIPECRLSGLRTGYRQLVYSFPGFPVPRHVLCFKNSAKSHTVWLEYVGAAKLVSMR